MSQYTPGPWTVEMGSRQHWHAHERLLILPQHSDDGSAAPIAKLGESRGGDYDVAAANARLIAAAPDLLSALKAAAAAINPSDIHGISLMTWNDRLKAATVTINAAIAKAEGRMVTA